MARTQKQSANVGHPDKPDYVFENHGSVWLCYPQSGTASLHLHEHTADDALWHGNALVVEPRYVESLAAALEADGYRTRY